MSLRPYYRPETFRSPATHSSNVDYIESSEKPWVHALGLSLAKFYAKQLVSQPFEVSEFLLQVHDFSQPQYHNPSGYESDSDEDIDYFVDDSGSRPRALPYKRQTRLREISSSMQLVPASSTPQALNLSTPSIFSAISAVSDYDGPTGLWRGINTSSLYVAGTSILEAWISGFLSAACGIPDAQFGDIMQSVDPRLYLIIAASAVGLTHALMSPISLIRAKFLVSKMQGPRSLRRHLLSAQIPGPHVWLPKVLSEVWSKLVQLATPWVLFQNFAVDEFRSPIYYNALSLTAEIVSLIVKIPLDTFYHRAQVETLNLPSEALIISPVRYKGLLHALVDLLTLKTSLSSIYRGWRLELVRVISKWGYTTLEVTQNVKERF